MNKENIGTRFMYTVYRETDLSLKNKLTNEIT